MNPLFAYEKRTEKLYETDGLLTEFDATVLDCVPDGDSFLIELDRTAFFPEGGGQAPDEGELDGTAVSFVEIKDGKIFHRADKPFGIGVKVHGKLDAHLRRRRMQHHGGEHIISGLLHSMYGVENAGFHMSENEITIDTASPVTDEMLRAVERRANEAIWENRKITAYYPDESELAALEYRSKTELSNDVRIVEIEGYDRCACCAPQLPSTAMIGLVRIKGFIKYKKGVRITAAAGEDALDYLRRVDENATQIARLYSSVNDEIYDAVTRREAAISEKLSELHTLKEKLLSLRLSAIEKTDKSIVIFEEGCDAPLLRRLATDGALLTDKVCAAFSARDDGGYNYVIAAREDDISPLASKLRDVLGGRGGGKGPMISGFVEAERDKIEKFFNSLD